MQSAVDYFKQGFSCSESIVKMAIDKGLVHESLLSVATPFSGGMSSGCLCGAISGAQLVIGVLYGKSANSDGKKSRELAKVFLDEFKARNKATCCRILTKNFEMSSPERKQHCTKMVSDAEEILLEIINIASKSSVS